MKPTNHLTPAEQFELEQIDREIRAAALEYRLFVWLVIPFAIVATVLASISIFAPYV